MSKAYKGKTCVYCCVPGSSTTGDHVIARAFFLDKFRSNLPKVAACADCNGEKSVLEHYLASVMPFANQHQASLSILSDRVPQRLANNNKLFRELRVGMQQNRRLGPDGNLRQEMSLPFDGEKLEMLLKMVAKGLCYFHWKLLLPPTTCDVTGGYLIPEGAAMVERLLSMNAGKRVNGTLGGGAFEYEGVQASDWPEITIWRMSIYDAIIEDGAHSPPVRASNAYVTTAPKGKALPINS